jgi:uncharacterized protein Usg
MIKLIVDPIVLTALKQAMPKTKKAEEALEKYISVLERHIDKSLMNARDNKFRFFKHFLLSTHDLSLEVGQFRISGKKQYLHKWLEQNKLNLIDVISVGLKGKDPSTVKLSSLVTMNDAMDLQTLKKKSINELDKLLDDKSLTDVDLFFRMFPDFATFNQQSIQASYDLCPINTKSLKQFIVWVSLRANKLNAVEKQMMLRQANVILRVAKGGSDVLPMKKKLSPFGRTYYEGISVQSVHRTLREAMLGKCYEYDLRTSVISWKMGFAQFCYQQMKTQNTFQQEFSACLEYLKDKKKFREQIRSQTFGSSSHIDAELQIKLVKEGLTALSFGARIYSHGWINQSGEAFNPAIVKIFKDQEARDGFIKSSLVKKFREEQKRLDDFIFDAYTSNDPSLLKNSILQSKSGRVSKSKVMSYLYQNAETIVMDSIEKEITSLGKRVLARVHDAIFIETKLSNYDRQSIEFKVRDITGIDYITLDEEKLKGFKGVSALVKKEEAEQQSLTTAQKLLAQKNLVAS